MSEFEAKFCKFMSILFIFLGAIMFLGLESGKLAGIIILLLGIFFYIGIDKEHRDEELRKAKGYTKIFNFFYINEKKERIEINGKSFNSRIFYQAS